MASQDPLSQYKAKRNFLVTPEPSDLGLPGSHALTFVVQKHWASSLHYDFRLELEGTLKSWAVPKGPSLDPTEKRLAVQVEDHPLTYAAFEGTIPAKQYGAGQVIVWDKGHWQPVGDPLQGFKDGNLKFVLHGHKLSGRWALVRMKGRGSREQKQPPWLLIKEKDAFAQAVSSFNVTDALPDSVAYAPPPELPQSPESVAPPEPSSTVPTQQPRKAGGGLNQLPGAVKTTLPAELAPQLATLQEQPPSDAAAWLFEIKLDGYRLLTRIHGTSVRVFTRNGHDWTAKLAPLVASVKRCKLPTGWYDGELVVLNSQGVPDFGALQAALEDGLHQADTAMAYYLFDLPFSQGYDLRQVPLTDRRAALQALLAKRPQADAEMVRFSQEFDAPAHSMLAAACQLGLEGVMGKRRDSSYRSARSADWIKLKCQRRQEFVIGGYTALQGSRQGVGALLLGVHDRDGQLVYAGKVGTGFTDHSLRSLQAQLATIATDTTPFSAATGQAGQPHWVQPQLVAEVRFADWTRSGHIRHAVFVALRADKDPKRVMREAVAEAAPTAPAGTTPAPAIRVTHADRVIDISTGITKGELVAYYQQVGELIMPHLKNRPVALVRAPQGTAGDLFFQKHAETSKLPGVRQLDPALYASHPPLLCVVNQQGVLSSAQWNVVEFHTQNTGSTTLETSDRMVLDLDPGEGVAWAAVQQAALLVQVLLIELKLTAFLKTSGGKGLHVVVPLKKIHTWQTVRSFSETLVKHLATTIPQLFVAKSGPKNRVGKIYVDYLRNGLGATTVSAWSARARPGLGISMPVAWEELGDMRGGNHWTIRNAAERMMVGNVPWAAYAGTRQTLTAALAVLQPPKDTRTVKQEPNPV